ncbi:MAG TPA: hypothetical protein VNP98_17275 [Chthoniobacterales bacterium]|nr:hypothetical protein [Chthoniobacterales bacterium]
MSGTLYLREFSRAFKRANDQPSDLFAQLAASDARKQFMIFGIRRTLRKMRGDDNAIDLERLTELELDQVRREIAEQFRRKQSEQALLRHPPTEQSNTEKNT